MALSSIEAKYIAIIEAFNEAMWLQGILKEIGMLHGDIIVYSNSHNAVYLCKNHVWHDKIKHVDITYNFVRDQIAMA